VHRAVTFSGAERSTGALIAPSLAGDLFWTVAVGWPWPSLVANSVPSPVCCSRLVDGSVHGLFWGCSAGHRRKDKVDSKGGAGRPVGQARISTSRVAFRRPDPLKNHRRHRRFAAFALGLLAGSEAVDCRSTPPTQKLRTDFIMVSSIQLIHNAISRKFRVSGVTSLVVRRLFTVAWL
jgi:hypothetical protein